MPTRLPAVTFEPPAPATESLPRIDPQIGMPSLDLKPVFNAPASSSAATTVDGSTAGRGISPGGAAAASAQEAARPRGSFFGVEGYGVSFVYIVDMSGSMLGGRFDRAVTELIQSVNALRPGQSFDVLMFSDQTVRMFATAGRSPGDSPGSGSTQRSGPAAGGLIPATPLNTVKLARWARSTYRAGHTQPSAAMAAALGSAPSGVFMLSDGRFDPPIDRAGVSMPSVFEQIADLARPIPVHCVALQDSGSRISMQRLADASGGNFHFQSDTAGPPIDRTLRAARLELQNGDRSLAIKNLRRLLAIRPADDRTVPVEQLFGDCVRRDAEADFAAGDWHAAAEHYVDLWLVRPHGEAATAIRRRLLGQMAADDLPALELMIQTGAAAEREPELGALRDRHTGDAVRRLRDHLEAGRWPRAADQMRHIESLTPDDAAAGDRQRAWQLVFAALHPGAGDVAKPAAAGRLTATGGRQRAASAVTGGGWLSGDRRWLLNGCRAELWRQSRLDQTLQTGISRRVVASGLIAAAGRQSGRQIQAALQRRESLATAALRRAESIAGGGDRYVVAQAMRDVAEAFADTQPGWTARQRWWELTAQP